MPDRIYLDHHATTPLDPRVAEAMAPFGSEKFGNSASRSHAFGVEADEAIQRARGAIAAAIGADPDEIVFTSGATESDNLALKGLLRMAGSGRMVTVATEHPAVLDTAKALEAERFRVTVLPVKPDGLLDLPALEVALAPDTRLVSVMAVNNEIGVVQPLEEIGAIGRRRGVIFHTDAAQAMGRIPIDVRRLGLGLASLSAHKCYGPKGVGALFVSKHKPRVKLAPLVHGGGHEGGLRSGTLPVPLIVGFARAVEIAIAEGPAEERRLRALRERLRKGICEKLEHVAVNGSLERRIGGNLNLSFAYVEGEALLTLLNDRGIAVSTGSACTTATLEPSHVLKALGVSDALIHSSIRFGLGRSTTAAAVDRTIEAVVAGVNKLRAISPMADLAREPGPLKTYRAP